MITSLHSLIFLGHSNNIFFLQFGNYADFNLHASKTLVCLVQPSVSFLIRSAISRVRMLHFVVLFLSVIEVLNYQLSPIVSITDGRVQGIVNSSVGSNREYYAYRGIPFANPPIGNLRFKAPIPNDPWTGILNATQTKEQCVQISGVLGLSITGSEDCLYLNVYTTKISGNLPVMVWIFGRGFTIGGAQYSSYAPDFILDRDIVFVSLNYRLAAFGFLSTGDLSSPGNCGIKDQILALRWVKRNIKSFGGNPNRITIVGQSAGSASISYILQPRKTKGLYHAPIMQSGASICLWSLTRTARQMAFALGARLRIFTADTRELVEELRKVDYHRLKRAENDVFYVAIAVDNIFNGLPMGPVVEPDHEEAVITEKSHELLRTGQFNKVPVIVRINSNEAKSFLGLFIDIIKPLFTRYDLNIAMFAPYDLSRNSSKRVLAGTEVKQHWFGEEPIVTYPSINIIKFISNEHFNRPIRETVNQMSKFTDVYYYEFGYRGSLGEFENDFAGVGHYEEIFYIFANKPNANSDDQIARRPLLELWSNFIKFGNPTPTSLEGTVWQPNRPKSRLNDNLLYLSINSTLSIPQNPYQTDYQFYHDFYQTYAHPPYCSY
nr:carboxylesterase [Dendroctonus armandi]